MRGTALTVRENPHREESPVGKGRKASGSLIRAFSFCSMESWCLQWGRAHSLGAQVPQNLSAHWRGISEFQAQFPKGLQAWPRGEVQRAPRSHREQPSEATGAVPPEGCSACQACHPAENQEGLPPGGSGQTQQSQSVHQPWSFQRFSYSCSSGSGTVSLGGLPRSRLHPEQAFCLRLGEDLPVCGKNSRHLMPLKGLPPRKAKTLRSLHSSKSQI